MLPSSEGLEPVTAQLCQWIEGLTLKDVPQDVVDRAKHLVLDGIGCALVGARVPWSKSAYDAIALFEARGDHPVVGYEEVCSIPLAYSSIVSHTWNVLLTFVPPALRPYHSRTHQWHFHPGLRA